MACGLPVALATMTFRAGFVCLALVFGGCHHGGLPSSGAGPNGPDDGGVASGDLAVANGNGMNPAQRCNTAKDDASCKALTGCFPIDCNDPCTAGPYSFSSCVPTGNPGDVMCPDHSCGSLPCTALGFGYVCDARSDCHSIFSGNADGCDEPGCESHFLSCADGAGALCIPPPVRPDGGVCHPWDGTCAAGDTFAYGSDGCVIGCVHKTVCGL